jgi:hypothetical protein
MQQMKPAPKKPAMQTEGSHKTGGLALAPGHECCYRVVQLHVLQVTCCLDVLHVYATTVLRCCTCVALRC